MKHVSVLGSTGSIGTQALSIIREEPEKFKVTAISCGSRTDVLAEQIREFKPLYAAVGNPSKAEKLQAEFPETKILSGTEGLNFIAAEAEADIVLNSVVGITGLEPTYNAILAGRDIALANKETLVAGGKLVTDAVKKTGVKLLPVDSEHSAVFQCLHGYDRDQVEKLILTCSGGPFRGRTREELESVTVEEALAHPNWSMGKKITVDSATLMNKGLEVIEAAWLFDMPEDKIDVVVHPESIIHSMVEYKDRAVLAQMGTPDMRIPISLALEYPRRLPNSSEPLDLVKAGKLTFEAPDTGSFPCLKYAREALRAGGTYPVAMNGANEVLVDMFLKGMIRFNDIPDGIKMILDEHVSEKDPDLSDILRIDREARKKVFEKIEKRMFRK